MTTSDKSSGTDKSVQQVVNAMPAVAKEPATQPTAQRTTLPKHARAVQMDREDASLEVPHLSEKTQEQELFEANAANMQAITNVDWATASVATPVPDVLLAQAAPIDGARTASDAAGANSGIRGIDWGVASNNSTSSSGFNSLWTGAALLGGLLVAGSSGGGNKNESNPTPDTRLKLTVQDGLIAGAKVYLKEKDEQHFEKDEQHLVGVTDAQGQLVLSKALTVSGVLIAVGGKNIDTGLANTLELKISFVGGLNTSSVMTPVTTLVAALVDSGYNLGAAETKVKAMLGLTTPQLSLSTYDPMATANAGSADALALRKAGAQIVQLASQMPDTEQFFTALATEVNRSDSWRTLVQDEGFVGSLLADQMPQMPVEQRAALSASMLKSMVDLGAVASADRLSTAQLSAARLNVALHQDTGTDNVTQNDHITTNAQLDIFGYNSGTKEGIEISLNGGAWTAFDKAQFTPNGGVQNITVKIRQTGLLATQSDELSFTWVSQTAQAPQLSLPLGTGTLGNEAITSNPHITFGQVNNQNVVVGSKTFTPKFEYSLNGADYQAVLGDDLFASLQDQTALMDGHYNLRVRTFYNGLSLESEPSRLSFTLDRQVTAPQGYAITAVDGAVQDPDTKDQEFSSQGATSVLFTLNQAPEAGAKVWLTLGQKTYDVLPQGGVWQTRILVEDLAQGANTPSIRIEDAAGNKKSADLPAFQVDNLAYDFVVGQDAEGVSVQARPEQIATLAPESDSFMLDNLTNVNLPVFEGIAEAGALVTLSVDGNTIGTGRANSEGAWRIASTAVLADGAYTPVVTMTDVAGNVSGEFEGAAFTIATNKPQVTDVILANVDPSADEALLALIAEVGFDPALLSAPYTDSAVVSAAGITFELTSLDTGADNADGITMFPLPRISGTVSSESGAGNLFVFVTLRNISPDADPADPLSTVKFAPIIADEDGNWTVQVKQPLGAEGESHTYVPYITVIDGAGNIARTAGHAIVIDRQAPEVATVNLVHDEDSDTGIDPTDGFTNKLQPQLQGTAEPGATVVVDVMGDGSMVYVATVESDGTWTVQVDADLPEGEWTPQVTVIDLAGNVSAPIAAEVSFTVDLTPPEAPTLNPFGDTEGNDTGTIKDDFVTANNTPTLSGTAEDGSFVTVTVGDWVSEPLPVVDGIWTVTVGELEDGEHTPSVVTVDAAGNESEAVLGETFTVLTTPPDVANLAVGLRHDSGSDTGDAEDNITNSAELLIEGTAPANMRVVVELEGTVYGLEGEEIIANSNGYWSVTITDLAEGDYTPVARLVDPLGNESANVQGEPFTVDLTPPEGVTANLAHDEDSDTGLDAQDSITNNPAPFISGTAEAGTWVTVTVGEWTADERVQVGEDGTWSVQLGVTLEDGTYTPTVKVEDVAGNSVEAYEGEPFTVKTTIEAPSLNAFGDTEGNDTGTLKDDFVTANSTPTLSGTAEDGAFVTVTVGDWVSDPIEVVGGEWSVTLDELPDGEYTPEVVAVDAAGNESEAVLGETFTVDTQMSEEPALAAFSDLEGNDTGVSLTDRITNNVSPVFEGQAEALAMVTLIIQQQVGNGVWQQVQEMEPIAADSSGHWTASLPNELVDGTYRAAIEAADAAGNASQQIFGQSFTVDTVAPVLPMQLAPRIFYINTPMNFWPDAGTGLHVVAMDDVTGSLPEGLTIDETSHQVTGLTEVAGFTWLSATMADVAGNEGALPVLQPLIFVSDIRPSSQTINHTSAAAAKLYQGTSGDDKGFSLFNAPGDVLLAKEGNDLVTVSNVNGMKFTYVDGGAGTDTMKFTVVDMAVDFSQFNTPASSQLLKNFEVFQFTGKDASVSISAADIFGMSSELFDAGHVYTLRIDGASGNQSATLTDLDPKTKIVTNRDGDQEVVNETFDATGNQTNYGLYHKYEGMFTDGQQFDRVVSLLIEKTFIV